MMKIFLGIGVEFLDIFLRQAHDGEKEVGDEGIQVRFEMSPHLLGPYTLV
jgi:hypothetical protein